MTARFAAFLLVLLPFPGASAAAQSLRPPEGSPPGIALRLAPPSPAELTEAGEHLRCAVETLDGRRHRFAVRGSGRRGYVDPATGKAEATESEVTVSEDPSGLLSAYADWESRGHRFDGHSKAGAARFGPHVRLQMERTDFDRDGPSTQRWAVLVQALFDWMPLTKAVGFCDVEALPVRPLDAEERRRHLKR